MYNSMDLCDDEDEDSSVHSWAEQDGASLTDNFWLFFFGA